MKKLTKQLFVGAAVVIMASPVFAGVHQVSADTISDAKSAISSNKSSASKLLAQLNEQQNQVAKLSNDVSNKIVAINDTQANIDATQTQITNLDGEIVTAKKELANRKSVLREQLVELQKQSTNSVSGNVYVDFLLNSDNFTDLVSRSLAVNKINSANKEAMDAVTESKTKLADLKSDQVNKQDQLVADKAKLVADKASLDGKKAATAAAQKELQDKVSANQAELETLQAQLDSATSQAVAAAAALVAAQTTATQAKTTQKVSTTNNAGETVTGTGRGVAIANNAVKYLGTPYAYGKASPSEGFDCSGLIWYSAKQAGISLPRTSQAMSELGSSVSLNSLQAGDLVFWGSVGSAYHVGIYVGGGRYVHAPTEGQTVTYQSIDAWRPSFARRI